MLQKFVTSIKYYIWGLSQKGLELFFYIFMKIKSMEVLVYEFMLDLVCTFFFYQYIVPPLVVRGTEVRGGPMLSFCNIIHTYKNFVDCLDLVIRPILF